MSKFRNFDKYEVFEDGRIWSYKSKKFLKPWTTKYGYKRVSLTDNEGNSKMYHLHRVVWEAVTGSPIPEGYEINHIDENKTNNHISNLNLMTPKENVNFGTCIQRRSATRSKTVGAFKNGELVMSFKNIMDADKNGYSFGCVARCCRGERKTHRGFEWRYI